MQIVHSCNSDTRCFTRQRDNIAAHAKTTYTLTANKDELMKEKIPFNNKGRYRRRWVEKKWMTFTTGNEMLQELNHLKDQYTTVCDQEAVLRSQIAMIMAEFFFKEAFEYDHRVPMGLPKISVKTDKKTVPIKKTLPTIERPQCIVRQLSRISQTPNKVESRKTNLSWDNKMDRSAPLRHDKNTFVTKPDEISSPCFTKSDNSKRENSCLGNTSEYCPYCSLIFHPPPLTNLATCKLPKPVPFTEFRLPKLKVLNTQENKRKNH